MIPMKAFQTAGFLLAEKRKVQLFTVMTDLRESQKVEKKNLERERGNRTESFKDVVSSTRQLSVGRPVSGENEELVDTFRKLIML